MFVISEVSEIALTVRGNFDVEGGWICDGLGWESESVALGYWPALSHVSF